MLEKNAVEPGEPIPLMVAENLGRIYNRGPSSRLSGLFSQSGMYQNPEQLSINTYRTMLETDETCSSGIEFVKLATLSRIGRYSHQNRQISDFINSQFERIRGSLSLVVDGMLTALWAGFSVGEMVLEYRDEKIQLCDVQFIEPTEVSFSLYDEGMRKNQIRSIVAGGLFSGGQEIPAEKLIIYTHRSAFGNPYGQSRFKPVYGNYFVKKQMIVNWARTLEKYGSPTAVGRVEDPDRVITDEAGNRMTQLEYMARVLDSIQTTTGVALSGSSDIRFLEHSAALGGDFESAVGYFNRMIYRGLLLPGLVGEYSTSGSQALGTVHFDLFVLSLERLKEEVTDVIIDQLIRPLITWNFGPQEDWGCFSARQFKVDDARLFAGIFQDMTRAGYISPDRYEDMIYVREKIGAPGISLETWEESKEELSAEEVRNQVSREEKARNLSGFRSVISGLLARFKEDGNEQQKNKPGIQSPEPSAESV